MTEDVKNPAKTEQAETPEVAMKPALKIGDKVRLVAVHGYIQHPWNLVAFDQDQSNVVVLDSWHLIQVEAGKLAVTE